MLTLPLKKKWFDMILSGKKKQEYREFNTYYAKRFRSAGFYDHPTAKICFRNEYGHKAPAFVASCSLSVGTGLPEWGAEPGKEYFVLHIKTIEGRET